MAEEREDRGTAENSWDNQLERWESQARWGAARLAYRLFPRLAVAALEIDASGLRPEGIPRLFARDLKEIDPRLNDDLLELYGRSEQALNNHFGFFGRTQKFEAEINWEPPESPAWRRELHACDYAFDLALTYRISGEELYARHLRYLIAHWIALNPPVVGSGWHPHAVARRLRNWILAADLARADWEGDREFYSLVNQSLALQATFLLRHASALRSPAEWLDASRALLLAHRWFGEGSEFRAAGRSLLRAEREFAGGKRGDASLPTGGWPTERLQRVHVLIEWLLFEPQGLEAPWLQEELRQALSSLESVLMPGGSLSLLGPAARACADEASDLAALAAVLLSGPESEGWKAWAGHFGILPYMLLGETGKAQFAVRAEAPRKAAAAFQYCGEFYRLNAPGSSALLVSAHFPSLPGDHGDFLSWELTMQGNRVVVDSGGYCPDEAEYFAGARAHNVLLVDGEASQPRDASEQMAAPIRKSGPGYAGLVLHDSGFRSRGLIHQRAWFSLEGGGWVVLDRVDQTPTTPSLRLRSGTVSKVERWPPPRRGGEVVAVLSSLLRRGNRGGRQAGKDSPGDGLHCHSLLHFYPAFELLADSPGGGRAIARSRACSFTLFPLGQIPARLRVSRGPASGNELSGWYAPEFGLRYPAGVLAVEWEGLLLPWTGGILIVPGERDSFRMLGCSGNQVSFEWSGRRFALEF